MKKIIIMFIAALLGSNVLFAQKLTVPFFAYEPTGSIPVQWEGIPAEMLGKVFLTASVEYGYGDPDGIPEKKIIKQSSGTEPINIPKIKGYGDYKFLVRITNGAEKMEDLFELFVICEATYNPDKLVGCPKNHYTNIAEIVNGKPRRSAPEYCNEIPVTIVEGSEYDKRLRAKTRGFGSIVIPRYITGAQLNNTFYNYDLWIYCKLIYVIDMKKHTDCSSLFQNDDNKVYSVMLTDRGKRCSKPNSDYLKSTYPAGFGGVTGENESCIYASEGEPYNLVEFDPVKIKAEILDGIKQEEEVKKSFHLEPEKEVVMDIDDKQLNGRLLSALSSYRLIMPRYITGISQLKSHTYNYDVWAKLGLIKIFDTGKYNTCWTQDNTSKMYRVELTDLGKKYCIPEEQWRNAGINTHDMKAIYGDSFGEDISCKWHKAGETTRIAAFDKEKIKQDFLKEYRKW